MSYDDGLSPEEIRQREEWQRQGMLASFDEIFDQYWRNQEREERRPAEADVPVEAQVVAAAEVVKAPKTPRPPKRVQAEQVVDARTVAAVEEALTPQSGGELLDAVETFLNRFVVWPSPEASDAATLWTAYAIVAKHFNSAPRIFFYSPEKECGKSQALGAIGYIVPDRFLVSSATPAAVYRLVDQQKSLTLFIDEIDTIFGPKNKANNEELRGLLNSGFQRGGHTIRCVGEGKDITVKKFSTFCAVAFGGVELLPDTLASRTIHIHMRQRINGLEDLENFSHVDPELDAEGAEIRERLAAWLAPYAEGLADKRNWPAMPQDVSDRNRDIWRPLVTVADLASPEWGKRARRACVGLSKGNEGVEESEGVRLLRDLFLLWPPDVNRAPQAWVPTETLLTRLHGKEEAGWDRARYGAPIDANWLARKLKPYRIKPHLKRDSTHRVRGYSRSQFEDPWMRLCPDLFRGSPTPSREPVPPVPPVTPQVTGSEIGTRPEPGTGQPVPRPESGTGPVQACNGLEDQNQAPDQACHRRNGWNGSAEGGRERDVEPLDQHNQALATIVTFWPASSSTRSPTNRPVTSTRRPPRTSRSPSATTERTERSPGGGTDDRHRSRPRVRVGRRRRRTQAANAGRSGRPRRRGGRPAGS